MNLTCSRTTQFVELVQWHDDGLPSPNVTVTARYATHEAIAVKLTDALVLEFEKDYRIRA